MVDQVLGDVACLVGVEREGREGRGDRVEEKGGTTKGRKNGEGRKMHSRPTEGGMDAG